MIEKIPHIKGPQTWYYSKFGEICKIIGGSQPPKKEFVFEPVSGYVRLIQIRDYKSDNHLTFIPESKARRFCSANDVMIGRYGPPIFQILRGIEGAYNVALMKARPIDKRVLDNEFLYFFLHNQTLRNYIIFHSTRTAGQDGVRKELLQEYPIYLPPFNEQKRIVTKIEALQTRSTAVKEELKAIKPLLDQFRQSVLAAAFRGDLTKDWRSQNPNIEPAEVLLERIKVERRRRWEEVELEKMKANGKVPKDDNWKKKYKEPEPINTENLPELPNGWCWVNLEELSKIDLGKMLDRGKEQKGKLIPYLRNINVRWDYFDLDDLLTMDFENHELERFGLKKGDILVCEGGEPGRCAVWELENSEIKYQKTLHRLRPFLDFSRYWIVYHLKLDAIQGTISNYCSGSTIKHLTKVLFQKYPIRLTSLQEQKEIVRRIESLFKLADNIEQQYQQAETNLETLNQSILAKAFRGELVPQDPNDEPASVLLERIRAERDKAKPKKSKTEKKRSSKKEDKQLGIPGI